MSELETPPVIAFVRLYAEVPDSPSAEKICDDLVARISAYGKLTKKEVYHYWKIEEYYGIFIELEPHKQDPNIGKDIILALGTGWKPEIWAENFDAIWNPSPDGQLFSTLVRWGHVSSYYHQPYNDDLDS